MIPDAVYTEAEVARALNILWTNNIKPDEYGSYYGKMYAITAADDSRGLDMYGKD
jgi:hypothetical protein